MTPVHTQRSPNELYLNFFEEKVPLELRFRTIERLLDTLDYIPIISWHSGHFRIILGALLFIVGCIKASAEAFTNSTSEENTSPAKQPPSPLKSLTVAFRRTTPSANTSQIENKLHRYQIWISHGMINIGRGVIAARMPIGTGNIILAINDITGKRFLYPNYLFKDYHQHLEAMR